jgi:RimJ/RimL family protein N-acetyltransferase
MAELGGPHPEDFARAAHRRRVAGIRDHGFWWFTVRRVEDDEPVGSIGVWASEVDGEPASETGWMIRPEYQGQGYASAALAAVLARAAAEGRWGDIHAFPGATNAASNALCRRFGFEEVGEMTVEYAGRSLRCNHWVLRAR